MVVDSDSPCCNEGDRKFCDARILSEAVTQLLNGVDMKTVHHDILCLHYILTVFVSHEQMVSSKQVYEPHYYVYSS